VVRGGYCLPLALEGDDGADLHIMYVPALALRAGELFRKADSPNSKNSTPLSFDNLPTGVTFLTVEPRL
jgi:hypothetical protein